jgi:predicted ABC-type ATPase
VCSLLPGSRYKITTKDISLDYTKLSHSIVILIRGLPGSGKSYLAARLQTAIGKDNVVMLDPDAIDYDSDEYHAHVKQQLAEGVDPKLHAYRFSRNKAYQGIEDHKIVLWNQPFTNLEIFRKMTDRFKEHAAEAGTNISIIVVEVTTDAAIAHKRVAERKQAGGHGPSDATFTRFNQEYTSAKSEGYDVIQVDGRSDVDESVKAILAKLNELVV